MDSHQRPVVSEGDVNVAASPALAADTREQSRQGGEPSEAPVKVAAARGSAQGEG